MSHSSCPCCSNPEVWNAVDKLLETHGVGTIEYCPVCSQPAAIRAFMIGMRKQILNSASDAITDENGKPMIMERTPWSEKPETKRMSYEVDLDKIDISRELELLEKHQDKENARKADLLAEHIVRWYMDKYGNQED